MIPRSAKSGIQAGEASMTSSAPDLAMQRAFHPAPVQGFGERINLRYALSGIGAQKLPSEFLADALQQAALLGHIGIE